MGQSGEADGADLYFHNGARASAKYPKIGFAAFIPYDGFRSSADSPKIFEDLHRGIYNADKFDLKPLAQEMAFEARGSFEGLGRGGIGLHTRNVYQVLTPTLTHPVQRLFMWATPVSSGAKVRGGTNTAFQLALKHNVPVVNLYHEDMRRKVCDFLDAHDKQHYS